MSSSTTSENRERKLTIIVSSPPAVGHVNACAGALRGALARGHRIIFVINRMFEGKLAKLGYKEHLFSMPNKDASMNEAKENPGEAIAALFQAAHIIGPYSPLEKLRSIMATFDQREQLADAMVFDAAIKEAAELYKPDLFYVDNELMPAVYYSGVPWVRSISIHPLFFYEGEEVLPPGGGGLGMDSDPSTWVEWTELRRNWHQSTTFNDLIEEAGYPRYPNDSYPQNSILTVYACPEELNYGPLRALPWFNLEVFNPPKDEGLKPLTELGVPQSFLSDDLAGRFSGHLIYASLGSMGSVDLDLMDRLISALSTSPHKYIISTGPRHEQLLNGKPLPANMWGGPFLPQTSIIPHVELVITHGGNNSVTETFAAGKPMLCLPLFGDQFDNAQRLLETGYGRRLDPYQFTDEQLREEVDRLLKDEALHKRCKAAAERLNSTDRHEQLAKLLEEKVLTATK